MTVKDIRIRLPKTGKGRRTAAKQAKYEAEVEAFADGIKELKSTLDFQVSSRGWCYIMEEYGLSKGEFKKAESLIVKCRKSGLLPMDICADDATRATSGRAWTYCDDESPEEYAQDIVDGMYSQAMADAGNYEPVAFWDTQKYYVEVWTEKADLKNLFLDACSDYNVPITSVKGWSDLNSRAGLMEEFSRHEDEGRKPVLLYCGDHDPGGLNISDSIRSNMEELSEAVGWYPDNLIIDRFGLNYDFIEEHGLTWIDDLETSSGGHLDSPRHHDHYKPYVQSYLAEYGVRKCEANALVVRPEAGRDLCREAIEKYIDVDALAEYDRTIQEQREIVAQHVREMLGRDES